MESATGTSLAGDRGDRGDFEQVRSAWSGLAAHATYFFQTPEWIELLARRLEGDVAWGAVLAGGRPAAVSILRRSVRRAAGVNIRMLSQVRYGEALHLYADGLLDREVLGQRRVGELVDASGPWHVLWLLGLRAASPWLELASGGLVRVEPNRGVGVLDTSREFGECWRALPENMRDSIRKARRKIDEHGGAEIVVTTGPEIAAAYERFVELEVSGWKAHQGGALANMPIEAGLWRDYLRIADTAQVRSLHIDGRLAAAQVTVTTARTLFLPSIAYAEDLANLSPSNVLMADLLESCCNDPAIDRIDCMAWQPWHPRWGMTREPTYSLVAFNHRTVRGLAARFARSGWELFNRASVRGSAARTTRRGSERVDE
ncbi:MAG TPA: GNAT family N-acetyltransferase [Solirubrobacteraceae bacterium]|nr:GNAT family N-acetyltransferase [Solirubrobacteraceae bacterium]